MAWRNGVAGAWPSLTIFTFCTTRIRASPRLPRAIHAAIFALPLYTAEKYHRDNNGVGVWQAAWRQRHGLRALDA